MWAKQMKQRQTISPQLIAQLEVLQLPIAELSNQLNSLALNCPKISFAKHSDNIISGDASIRVGANGLIIEVAEPSTGSPTIEAHHSEGSDPHLEARWFIDSVVTRRKLLYRLTEQLLDCFPEIATRGVYATVSISQLAEKCDIPVTTVSRLLSEKKLQTDSGILLYCDFCDQSKGPRTPT